MYIRKKDFKYFESLYKSLKDIERKRFLNILVKSTGKKKGTEILKVRIIEDETFDMSGIEPDEILTRLTLNKAYKTAREK